MQGEFHAVELRSSGPLLFTDATTNSLEWRDAMEKIPRVQTPILL